MKTFGAYKLWAQSSDAKLKGGKEQCKGKCHAVVFTGPEGVKPM